MKINHIQVAGKDRKGRTDKSDTDKNEEEKEKKKNSTWEKNAWNKIKQEIHRAKNILILTDTEIHEAKYYHVSAILNDAEKCRKNEKKRQKDSCFYILPINNRKIKRIR